MPRMMITSLMRPVMKSSPVSSRNPRSPVRSQRSSASFDARPEGCGGLGALPIALGDIRAGNPDLADITRPKPAARFRSTIASLSPTRVLPQPARSCASSLLDGAAARKRRSASRLTRRLASPRPRPPPEASSVASASP